MRPITPGRKGETVAILGERLLIAIVSASQRGRVLRLPRTLWIFIESAPRIRTYAARPRDLGFVRFQARASGYSFLSRRVYFLERTWHAAERLARRRPERPGVATLLIRCDQLGSGRERDGRRRVGGTETLQSETSYGGNRSKPLCSLLYSVIFHFLTRYTEKMDCCTCDIQGSANNWN